MRILWISDGPTTPSGFGAVTREVCGRLRDRGHRIEILGWQTHGGTTWWQDIPVHPVRNDTFGADVVLAYLMRVRPDFVVSLADVWWMGFLTDPQVQAFLDTSGTRWVHYYPVDGATPEGVLPVGWAELLRVADVPLAMSEWGRDVSRASGVDAGYVPHGVDVEVFAPPPDREAAKAALGYGGRFLVLSDARNQPRKLLPRTLDVMRLLAADSRFDDVVLHLHCDPRDPASRSDLYGYSVLHDLEALRLLDRVQFTAGFQMRVGGGLPVEHLARLYQAADMHLLSSWGEGFGLPTLQAASAGAVPVAVAGTASRELVQGHGYPVPVESTMLDEFGMQRLLLSREAAAEAIAECHQDRALLAERQAASRAFALAYCWDGVVDQWEQQLSAAPPRRKPVRSRTYGFVVGGPGDPALPSAVAGALRPAVAGLPEGTSLQVRVSERRHGEVAGRILRATLAGGDELSVPVRLAPLRLGRRKANVGWLMAGPASLPALGAVQAIFPGTRIAVTTPGLDVESTERLPLEELVASLPSYVLVVDHGGDACPGIDLACAVLGVPYLGASPWWPPVEGAVEPDAASAVRRLLTDQGYSQWRRDIAHRAVCDALPREQVRALEVLAFGASVIDAEVDAEVDADLEVPGQAVVTGAFSAAAS